MQTKKLPDKPSELLKVALRDLKKCSRDPRYIIDMSQWHFPEDSGQVCRVCLAGALMAQSLQSKSDDVLEPLDFDSSTNRKLRALDYLRTGKISYALNLLSIDTVLPEAVRVIEVTSYEDNPKKFQRDMKRIAWLLRKLDL